MRGPHHLAAEIRPGNGGLRAVMQCVKLSHARDARHHHLKENEPRRVENVLRAELRQNRRRRQRRVAAPRIRFAAREPAQRMRVGIDQSGQCRLAWQPACRREVRGFAGKAGDPAGSVGEEREPRLELIPRVDQIRQPAALA